MDKLKTLNDAYVVDSTDLIERVSSGYYDDGDPNKRIIIFTDFICRCGTVHPVSSDLPTVKYCSSCADSIWDKLFDLYMKNKAAKTEEHDRKKILWGQFISDVMTCYGLNRHRNVDKILSFAIAHSHSKIELIEIIEQLVEFV